MAEQLRGEEQIRALVHDRYAAAARSADTGKASCCAPSGVDEESASCGCAADPIGDEQGFEAFGAELYSSEEREALPDEAELASLGCGNPTAIAELHEGETVLDLGSGGGIDVLLSARRVGPSGMAYGLDMTDEMLELARENERKAGVGNVEWLKGTIEDVPLPDDSVDVVISNCVINLSADKPRVFREAARVLRPGGRFAVSDVIADPSMDAQTRRDIAQWTGCIAGALTRDEYAAGLEATGFEAIGIRETHRVHEHAASAIIRALKPAQAKAPVEPHDLPIVECRLDLTGLRAQRDRYRAIGRHLRSIERRPRRLEARFAGDLDAALVREAIEVERTCCPFFVADYDAAERRLSITVEDPAQDPALDALRHALTDG